MEETNNAIHYDFYKHFSTISSGGLALTIGFAEKIAARLPDYMVTVLVTQFGISFIAAIAMMGLAVIYRAQEMPHWMRVTSFVVGFCSIAIFTVGAINLATTVCQVYGYPPDSAFDGTMTREEWGKL